MPDASHIGLFAAAALALLLIPGPAVLFIVAQSVRHGRAAGLVSVLGIHAGSLVHVAAASLGLSSLLVSSAEAYAALRYAGAAYHAWLGVRRLLGREAASEAGATESARHRRLLRDGFVVNLLNPKTALFFFAFLPQFIDPDAGAVALQSAIFGLVFVGLGLISDSLWALAAGTASGWIRGNASFARAERLVSGTVLVGLGVVTAATGARQSSHQ
jgi:threonine/homoserine/homoserine lactone efflux protein